VRRRLQEALDRTYLSTRSEAHLSYFSHRRLGQVDIRAQNTVAGWRAHFPVLCYGEEGNNNKIRASKVLDVTATLLQSMGKPKRSSELMSVK
jgi:hypothetical protein